MHPSISINTLSLPPTGLDKSADDIARLGASGISPEVQQVMEIGRSSAARIFRDAQLQVATLTHRAFAFSMPDDATLGRERLDQTIEIASQIGAQSITMTTGGRGPLAWTDAVDRFADAIAPCAERARLAGIKLAVEPTSHLYADASIAHRLSDTVRIVRQAGIWATVDLFACWFDADIDTAITAAAPVTATVQVSDYVYGDRGLPCRAVPGDGAIPLDALIGSIISAGYAGWFDLEIVGPRLQAEGWKSGLRRAAERIAASLDGTKAGRN